MFNYEKAVAGKVYFRATLLEAVGVTALLSFVASSHTFGLLTELVIAPLLIALAAIVAVSERDEALRSAHTGATTLLVLLSLLMLGNSIYQIVVGFGDFATSHTAREAALPVVLTAMFLPFLYGQNLYAAYDRAFNSFDLAVEDTVLRSYTRRKLVVAFGLDTTGLEKWRRHAVMFEPRDTADVNASIREIKQARRRERRPHRVPPPLVWLPNQATQFLVAAGLPTNDYHRVQGGWWAISSYLEIGEAMLPSNLAYYVEGKEVAVSKLKLKLNVNAPDDADRAYQHFFKVVSLLVHAAIPGALRNGKGLSIRVGDAPLLISGYVLALRRNDWPSGVPGGHDLALTIEVADEPPSA